MRGGRGGNGNSIELSGMNREMALITGEQSCTEQLARFFPKLPVVRIAVRVAALRGGNSAGRLQETAIVEFASEEYAIFSSTLPLEFDDRLSMAIERGGSSAEAAVIALQYHEGRKAVAVRFLAGPCEWMRQP